MLIVALRTDKPDAELVLLHNTDVVESYTWQAHRALAETLHTKIKELLERHDHRWKDIEGLIVFKGPGSFTGLRIGITVANTIADTMHIPIIGGMGDNWLQDGSERIAGGGSDGIVMPEYGAPVHITAQKK